MIKFLLFLLLIFLLGRLIAQSTSGRTNNRPDNHNRKENRTYTSGGKESSTITRINEPKKKVLDSSEAEYASFEEIKEEKETTDEG